MLNGRFYRSREKRHYDRRTTPVNNIFAKAPKKIMSCQKKMNKRSSHLEQKDDVSSKAATKTGTSTPTKKSKLKQIKLGASANLDLPYGTIVSINGMNVYPGKWNSLLAAPTFYGLVQDPIVLEEKERNAMLHNQSLVEVIVAGEVEWYDKNVMNTIQSVFYNDDITVYCLHQGKDISTRAENDKVLTTWFERTPTKWMFKQNDDICHWCGSPLCIWYNYRKPLKALIGEAGKCVRSSNKDKRYKCYRDAVTMCFGLLGHGNRVRTGWCFENAVRRAFPDDRNFYVGYMNTTTGDVEATENVIDLS